jgi:hypothetical protein
LLHHLVADQLMNTFGPVWLARQNGVPAPIELDAGASGSFPHSSATPSSLETPGKQGTGL